MRVMAIAVFIRGRDMGSLVAEMEQKVSANVPMHPGDISSTVWGLNLKISSVP